MVSHYVRKRPIEKTCSKCGVSELGAEFYHGSRICKPCASARALAYKALHPDRIQLYRRTRYVRHKDRLNAQSTAFRLKREGRSPDDPAFHARVAIRAEARARFAALSPEEKALHRKTTRTKNARRSRARHPEKFRAARRKAKHTPQGRIARMAADHRRRARKRALPALYTPQHWRLALDYWHHACAVCKAQEGFWWTLAMDHWIPLADPLCPGTVPWNIVPLCNGTTGCNTHKINIPAKEWLIKKLGKNRALHKVKEIESFLVYMHSLFGSAAT